MAFARSAAASRAMCASPACATCGTRRSNATISFSRLTGEVTCAHRHGRPWFGLASRREAFQISPQPPQRQYVFSSGVRAVVVIAADRHAGQTVGDVAAAAGRDRPAAPLLKSDGCIELPMGRSPSQQRVDDDNRDNDQNRRSNRDLPTDGAIVGGLSPARRPSVGRNPRIQVRL